MHERFGPAATRGCWQVAAAARAQKQALARGFLMFVLSWETNSDSRHRQARSWPSCATLSLPWLEHTNEQVRYWKSNKTHENKGTTAAGQAQGLRVPSRTLPCQPQLTETETETETKSIQSQHERQIARCKELKQELNLYSPVEAPRRGEGLGRQPVVPKQVVLVARVCKGLDCKSRASCEAGCDRFR